MSDESRVDSMARKLAVYAQRAGFVADDVTLITRAYELAVWPRVSWFRDVFHPDLLHPARTALILLDDVGCREPPVLAAAVVTETLYAALQPGVDQVSAALGQDVARLYRTVPQPATAGEALLEALVTAPEDVLLIALAERLDHARHLHQRPPEHWRRGFDEIMRVYLPVAERTNPQLAKRYGRWAHGFEKRLAR